MATGTVKQFYSDKGYGFIVPDGGGKDVFVHVSEVTRSGMHTLVRQQRLSYDIKETDRGLQARNLKLVGDPRPAPARPAPPRRSGSDSRGSRPTGDGHTIDGYEHDGEGLKFDTGYQIRTRDGTCTPVKVDSLKVTDRFLAARPESKFEQYDREMVLARYAPSIAGGLNVTPDIDDNPYNFASWMERDPQESEQPCAATHEQERQNRLSGSIGITFTARTPIFVPAGKLDDADSHSDPPRDFFHCWDGSGQRYAIPGSSVKGAVRSLFEALTNSRAGVTDEAELKWKPLYRRRSFRLFRIVSMPTETTCGHVEECDYWLYDRSGNVKHRPASLPDPQRSSRVSEVSFRANLFWVEPAWCLLPHGHTHKWTKIRYRSTGTTFTLDHRTLQGFLSMKGHPHLENHGGQDGTAARAAKCYYGPRRSPNAHAPAYGNVKGDLFGLNKGDLIFGLPDGNKRIVCFGKNVNFLWPSDKSTLDMVGKFAARAPDESRLAGSDPAEAVFGFAGTYRKRSHPFRGRMRFSVFWGPEVSDQIRPCLKLMPLTSPSGTKAKSRPLYLGPGADGKRSAEHDSKARLRGRKFYWHQKGKSGDIPSVHRLDTMMDGVPSAWESKIEQQLGAPIRPLPGDTKFGGTVHFSNLTSAELGALLISLKPDLAFDGESSGEAVPRYGLKLGKGKPRGLGSVTSELELRVVSAPDDAYGCLEAPVTEIVTDIRTYVACYKKWIAPAETAWDDLELAKSLRVLLRLPNAPSARVYPPQFKWYGWLPEPSDRHIGRAARGAPSGERYPKAMTPAHDL